MKKLILNKQELEKFRKEERLQPFRVKQINQEIFKNSNIDFYDMTTLAKDLREKLNEKFNILNLDLKEKFENENTTKFSFKTEDGKIIESVLMYHFHEKEGIKKLNRITLCISSQIGCPIGCKFCLTGKMGFIRNLGWEEIISQILYANNYVKSKFGKKEDGTLHRVRNLVFMGMGEPLLNIGNIEKSLEIVFQQSKLSLSKRHVTISTVGIVKGIEELITKGIDVGLAISLHSPNQQLREQLIPIAYAQNLNTLKRVLQKYSNKFSTKIFIEYIMIKDTTDTIKIADELIQWCKGIYSHINLIQYNETQSLNLKSSSDEQITRFKQHLEQKGLTVTIRNSHGEEIKGACGQLSSK